jgi:hypothetical protein
MNTSNDRTFPIAVYLTRGTEIGVPYSARYVDMQNCLRPVIGCIDADIYTLSTIVRRDTHYHTMLHISYFSFPSCFFFQNGASSIFSVLRLWCKNYFAEKKLFWPKKSYWHLDNAFSRTKRMFVTGRHLRYWKKAYFSGAALLKRLSYIF